jgi:hypothetical protein
MYATKKTETPKPYLDTTLLIDGRYRLWYLKNVLTGDECKSLIYDLKSADGVEDPWKVTKRFYNKTIGSMVWPRVRPFIQETFRGHRVLGIYQGLFSRKERTTIQKT